MKKKIPVSVVIPTYKGVERISNALTALENQSHSDFQTIIVIDGITDSTPEVVENFRSRLNLLVIEQHNMGRAGARNSGAFASDSDLIIFLDDDMRPERNWLAEHVQHYRNHPDSAMVGRQQSDPDKSTTDFHAYLVHRSMGWMGVYAGVTGPMNYNNLFFTSANCSVPRKIFESVSGFDATLSDAEDFDLGYRMLQRNVPIYFNNNCIAWHDDFPELRQYILRQREYRQAWIVLSNKNPEMFTNTARFDPGYPYGLKKSFFKLFANPFWIRVAESRIFLILPQKVRFRLYDYIIASLGRFNMHIKLK